MKNKIQKLNMIILISLAFVSFKPQALAAGYSVATQITSIQVQDNRTWIYFEPSIGDVTSCGAKTSVEVSNEGAGSNPNRDLIMTVALSALATGQPVVWLTTDNCSNVNKDIVRGVKVFSN